MTVPRRRRKFTVGKTESIARGRGSEGGGGESRVGVTRLSWAARGGEGEGRREGDQVQQPKGQKDN